MNKLLPARGHPGLGDLRLVPSVDTPLLNKCLKNLPKRSVRNIVKASGIEAVTLTPLNNMPNMPLRGCQYKVELQKTAFIKYAKNVKKGRIFVWNSSLPAADQRQYRLFAEHKNMNTKVYNSGKQSAQNNPEPADRDKFFRRGGPLDTNICPTKLEAEKIASEACRLLNKYTYDIVDSDFPDEFEWMNARGGDSDMHKTIELMSLLTLAPNFDFQNIRHVYRFSERQNFGQYCLSPVPSKLDPDKSHKPLRYKFFHPMLHAETQKGRNGDIRLRALFSGETTSQHLKCLQMS
ncbi:hypothetical protein BKA63DRAFT_567904 [Paraphoma chrysanthemicola]|nr:hypothetical protein BKA63DRAFT_567904 [Paraphoma chrysanthemicola]